MLLQHPPFFIFANKPKNRQAGLLKNALMFFMLFNQPSKIPLFTPKLPQGLPRGKTL